MDETSHVSVQSLLESKRHFGTSNVLKIGIVHIAGPVSRTRRCIASSSAARNATTTTTTTTTATASASTATEESILSFGGALAATAAARLAMFLGRRPLPWRCMPGSRRHLVFIVSAPFNLIRINTDARATRYVIANWIVRSLRPSGRKIFGWRSWYLEHSCPCCRCCYIQGSNR
jgi:hypothetical protein